MQNAGVVGPSLIGRVLAERYELQALLGKGGMGAVFRAQDRVGGGHVALKVVLPGEDGPRLIPRIMREARLAARLQHPHVVTVLDHGRWGEGRGSFYLTMELVDGVTLSELMGAPMSPGTASGIVSQLLSALAHVHARGVLHRDIKPDNIMVSRDPSTGKPHARIADFGLAAAFGGDGHADMTRLTREGSVLGTPHYMAPEQIEGRSLGPAVDLYAVGLILYELLTGELPFQGTLQRILFDKLSKEPARPEVELPDGLEDVLMRAIAPAPSARFPLAADALLAIRPFVDLAPIEATRWAELRGGGDAATNVPSGGPTLEAVPDSELVGRDEELAAFERLARRAEAGEGVTALVRGGPGVGKSALVERVAVDLNEAGRFFVLRGRTPPGGGIVSALRAALEDRLGTRGRPADAVETAVEASLSDGSMEDVGELMALLRPSPTREVPDAKRASATFVRALRRISRERPVFVVLDDLPSDAGLAAFVELLVFELALEPFSGIVAIPLRSVDAGDPLHAALSRTASSEGRQRHLIDVGPIGPEALAAHLEGARGLSPHVALRVARRAEGNPLFAEHLAGVEGLDTPATLSATASRTNSELPVALRGLLEASLEERLARTRPRERVEGLLRSLAVLGAEVDLGLLESFLEPGDAQWLEDDLDALIEVGVLSDAGLDEVSFAQRLTRDVALAKIPPRRRRRLHARAARLREERGGDADIDAVGEHWAAAGEMERAADAWVRAHEHARGHGDQERLLAFGRRALVALSEQDERRPQIALTVGRALRRDAQLDEAAAVLEPLLDHADADVALLGAELLAEAVQERNDIEAWRDVVARVRPRAEEGSRKGRAAYCRMEAFLANQEMEPARSLPMAREALELAETAHDELVAARRLLFAVGAADGDLREMGAIVESAVSRVEREAKEHEAEALRLALVHDPYSSSVMADYDRLLEFDRRAGSIAVHTATRVNRAAALAIAGRHPEALEAALEAAALAARFSLVLEQQRATGTAIIASVELGQAERALALIPEDFEVTYGSVVYVFFCVLWAATGRLDELPRAIEEGALFRMPTLPYFNEVLSVLGRILVEAGESELARPVLKEVLRRHERYGYTKGAERARARLAELAVC